MGCADLAGPRVWSEDRRSGPFVGAQSALAAWLAGLGIVVTLGVGGVTWWLTRPGDSTLPTYPMAPGVSPSAHAWNVAASGDDRQWLEPLVPALAPAVTACLPPPTQLPLGTSVGYRICRAPELVFERVVHERAWIPTAVDDACVLRALRAHRWPEGERRRRGACRARG
ncbi:MAG: hypothetical protein H6720_22445 [Sandaracinus sp.]|nr:hypothetical protein [Sandaracinus sp.]